MYLALLLILMAWIIRQGNLVAVILAITFVWQLTHFQIRAEEKALEEKFGEKYSEYRSKVRRWI
jgi:protein-S-isoprenylcysteine O-methyltransferase Ste14